MNTELQSSTKLYAPIIGMMSPAGISGTDYPLNFGNCCSIHEGPYLCNMWAENLQEWARRNPDSGPIEVTTVKHGERWIGYVSDERLKGWCNSSFCVTGQGWPSVAAMRHICATLGFAEDDVCGCEAEMQPPRISQRWVVAAVRREDTVDTITNRCHYCGRTWEKQK